MSLPRALTTIFLALLLGTSALGQQQPRFAARADVVRFQVSVLDHDGRFVSGLGPEDFEVLIDGEPRTILDTLEVDPATLAAEPTDEIDEPWAASGPEAVVAPVGRATASRRHFLLLLDLRSANRRMVRYARDAAIDMMETLVEPTDRVGLAIYSPLSGLSWPVPFTGSHDTVTDALEAIGAARGAERTPAPLDGLPEGYLDTVAALLGEDAAGQIEDLGFNRAALSAEQLFLSLEDLGLELATTEATTHVVLLSRGLSDAFLQDAGIRRSMERAVEELRASNVVLHTFYPDRMTSRWIGDPSTFNGSGDPGVGRGATGILDDRGVLHYLAGETGGDTTWFRHNLNKGLTRLEESTRSYYVLSIPIRPEDSERIPIEVRVARADLVVARAPTVLRSPRSLRELSEIQRQLLVAEALEPRNDLNDIAFGIGITPVGRRQDTMRFALTLQVEPDEIGRLLAERDDDALRFEVLALLTERSGRGAEIVRGGLNLPAGAFHPGMPPLRFVEPLDLPTGSYRLKLLLREAKLGQLSSRTARIRVPPSLGDDLWMSSPTRVLAAESTPVVRRPPADAGEEAGDALVVGGYGIVPDLSETTFAGARLRLLTTVANLGRHPFSGEYVVSVQAGLGIPGEDVLPLEFVRRMAIEPDASGLVRLLAEAELPRVLAPGDYRLILRLQDGTTGETIQRELPLIVLP